MSLTTITGTCGDVVCVKHADGGVTIIAFGDGCDGIITLDADVVKRNSDRRRWPKAALISETSP